MNDQHVRPRFGTLLRRDGSTVPLVFHPSEQPGVFVGKQAGDEQPVEFGPGDQLQVDAIGAGQSVVLEIPGEPT